MKKEVSITFIEIEKWLKENKENLVNSVIKKIKQKENIFYFKLYNKKTFHLIVYLPYFMFFSDSSIRTEKPSNFQMVLRKFLENKRIVNVSQKEFDRIIILELHDENKVIFEFFSEGNIIIVDKNNKITDALIKREWKDRKIEKDVEYKFPPGKNLLKKPLSEIFQILKNEDKNLSKFLTESFGLNLYYSNEILKTLNISDKICKEVFQKELDTILMKINEILESKNFYLKESEIIWIGSLEVEGSIKFEKINDAFKYAYNILEKKKIRKRLEEVEEKTKKILESIERRKGDLEKRIENLSTQINLIQSNFHLIQEISNKILDLRKLNVDWQDIKNIIKKQYKEVVDIDEHKSLIKLNLDNSMIEVDFRSVRNYLESLFEERKKLKEKLEKTLKAELPKIEVEKETEILPIQKEEKRAWYEKFRWFISSDGYLVVSGKDAETNEELIRKYTRDYDLVLHADIHGSPFTVIRNDKKQAIPPQTIYEAAQFTACYSQAWDLNIGIIPVYYVYPNQLVKANLPKGSFLIKGQRNWLEKVKLRLSIGVYEENGRLVIFSAPPVAARKKTQYIITLVPGTRSAEELVKEIRKHFESILPVEFRQLFEEINDEEIKRLIPFGKGELVRA